MNRILQIGRAHVVRDGAAALSLRAVTRELGMVSSAVYRYVADRDELLTLLIVDAYDELADTVDAAVSGSLRRSWSARVLLGAHAVRVWALAEPARYALLYGTPVPGYAAPGERTTGPGTRVARTLLGLVAEGVRAGDIEDQAWPPPLPEVLRRDLAAIASEFAPDVPPTVLARAFTLYSVVFGAVSLELFGQYGPDAFHDAGQLFDHEVRVALEALQSGTS